MPFRSELIISLLVIASLYASDTIPQYGPYGNGPSLASNRIYLRLRFRPHPPRLLRHAPASGPAERTPRAHPPASPAFLLTRYREATYAAALSAAIAPSETAVTTWRRPFARTSPAANTPGTLVAPDSSATM